MPKSSALLITEIAREVQDPSKSWYTDAELLIQFEDAIRELSDHAPNVRMEIFEFESRTGTATATSAGYLVDTGETQFIVANDINKVIFNTTDRTWAIVVTDGSNSTSKLKLSKDIMASGESYKMFNRGCSNNKQIYLGDIEDHVGDDHGARSVEYPIDQDPQELRNFKVVGNILTVGIDFDPPGSKLTSLSNRLVEVYVEIARKHQVSRLTDLAGTVSGAEVAGATSMDFADLSGSEVVAEDTAFTVASARGLYHVTEAVTLSTGSTTGNGVKFWPPALDAFDDGAVVTITGSTLNRTQERQVVGLAAARAVQSKGAALLNQARAAMYSVNDAAIALAAAAPKVQRQVDDVTSGRTAAALAPALLTSSNTEVGKMSKQVGAALATLDTATALTNRSTRGANVPVRHGEQARTHLLAVSARLETTQGYLAQATAEGGVVTSYAELGAAELAGAVGSVNEALGAIEKEIGELAIVSATREFSSWGREKANRIIAELEGSQAPNQRIYGLART